MDHVAETEQVLRLVTERSPSLGPMCVEWVDLTESTLTADGPVYETVARFPL